MVLAAHFLVIRDESGALAAIAVKIPGASPEALAQSLAVVFAHSSRSKLRSIGPTANEPAARIFRHTHLGAFAPGAPDFLAQGPWWHQKGPLSRAARLA